MPWTLREQPGEVPVPSIKDDSSLVAFSTSLCNGNEGQKKELKMEQNRLEESEALHGVGSSLSLQEFGLEESVRKEENMKVEGSGTFEDIDPALAEVHPGGGMTCSNISPGYVAHPHPHSKDPQADEAVCSLASIHGVTCAGAMESIRVLASGESNATARLTLKKHLLFYRLLNAESPLGFDFYEQLLPVQLKRLHRENKENAPALVL